MYVCGVLFLQLARTDHQLNCIWTPAVGIFNANATLNAAVFHSKCFSMDVALCTVAKAEET